MQCINTYDYVISERSTMLSSYSTICLLDKGESNPDTKSESDHFNYKKGHQINPKILWKN